MRGAAGRSSLRTFFRWDGSGDGHEHRFDPISKPAATNGNTGCSSAGQPAGKGLDRFTRAAAQYTNGHQAKSRYRPKSIVGSRCRQAPRRLRVHCSSGHQLLNRWCILRTCGQDCGQTVATSNPPVSLRRSYPYRPGTGQTPRNLCQRQGVTRSEKIGKALKFHQAVS